MGGDSYSSSSSSLDSGESSSMGSQRELINMRGAQLFLIDGEESVLMTSGEFSLRLLKQMHSPLAAVVANVGQVQWPVGKDAPVLKVCNRRYTFALPGLVYGMILPDSTPVAVLHHFDAILSEYGTFEAHHEIANTGRDDHQGFWTAVAPEVETLSSRMARSIDSTSTTVASSIVMGGDWAATWMRRKAGTPPEGGADGGVSPRMMRRMQQARRISAVAKLISRTLLKGTISATGHVSRNLDVNVHGPSSDESVAVASVDAFGKVVEAVETAGKSLYDVTQERFGHEVVQVDGFGAVGNVISTAWTLNKMGVKMLLRMTAASTALSTRTNSRSATTNSTVTDNQSLSSSMSTGSMPMNLQHSPLQPLHHEISLSTHEVARSDPLYLVSPAPKQQLQTSQLFPTSAEQLRHHAPAPVYMPAVDYAGAVPQQYHWNMPHVQASFSFQPARANMRME